MSKTPTVRLFSWSFVALALAMAVATFGLQYLVLTRAGNQTLVVPHELFAPLTALTYMLVGALVIPRHPRNPIGWLFCLEGVLAGLIALTYSYDLAATGGELALPGSELARWLNIWTWIPVTLLPISFILLLFPDGHLPSVRWRPVAWSAGLGIGLYTLGTALHPRPPTNPVPPVNPFGIPGAAPVMDLLSYVSLPFLIFGSLGSMGALVIRFRRSRGIEREQLKLVAYAGLIVCLGLLVITLLSSIWPGDPVIYEITLLFIHAGLDIVGIAVGIAILRHHLYNIDLLINRTLVYGTLSACVVGVYVLLVGSLGILFQSSGNFALTLIATGLAAFLVQPLRTRLQRSVNRLMYGERDNPYTVLSHLSQQLKVNLVPEAVLPTIAEAVAQTLKLPYVALALKQDNRLEIAAAYGTACANPLPLPLVYQAETVGQLLVAPRAPGEVFTPTEQRLLEDIALQAGVAAHAVRLTADLQRARERLVTAREEERRRMRRDLHDGLGPQLASLTLTVAAARELLPYDPKAADMLLQELAGHAQAAIADIRRLVYALRPPVLDDLGLVPALREQVDRYNHTGLQITINAPNHLPSLPAAVEVAAYRIVQEALTNVVRHAQANSCAVSLALSNSLDALELEIRDDGTGLLASGRSGVGLTSMRERTAELGGTFQVNSGMGQGTGIHVRLPLRQQSTQESNREFSQEELWSVSAS